MNNNTLEQRIDEWISDFGYLQFGDKTFDFDVHFYDENSDILILFGAPENNEGMFGITICDFSRCFDNCHEGNIPLALIKDEHEEETIWEGKISFTEV